jgi:UDP-2-acetamido-2,6-beta-L-arabino-hexul-4-ose reductase
MKVLITGADGFIGKNISLFLQEKEIEIVRFTRNQDVNQLSDLVDGVDWIIHLAGVNRPDHKSEFYEGNVGLTENLCETLKKISKKIPVIFASSIQAEFDNDYGLSKRQAENALKTLKIKNDHPIFIYRLPNVFGKWAKPNYNSAIATFCHNIVRDMPVEIHDPKAVINMVYIDDVADHFLKLIQGQDFPEETYLEIDKVYSATVGELVSCIQGFYESRDTLIMEPVGTGLLRALYATYVSYLPIEKFAYNLMPHEDERGLFAEMLKTKDTGQFSVFTAHPGVTRGGHYHHTKTEKFLVIKGSARFGFRNLSNGDHAEIFTSGDHLQVIETVPGWAHDITNIGNDELICLLWANEIFNREHPDTFVRPVHADHKGSTSE